MPNDPTRPFVSTEVAASLALRLKDDEPGTERTAEAEPTDGLPAAEPTPFHAPPTVLRRA